MTEAKDYIDKILKTNDKLLDLKRQKTQCECEINRLGSELINQLKMLNDWELLVVDKQAFRNGNTFSVNGNYLYQEYTHSYFDDDAVVGIVIDLTKSLQEQIDEAKIKLEKKSDKIKKEEIELYHKLKEKYNL